MRHDRYPNDDVADDEPPVRRPAHGFLGLIDPQPIRWLSPGRVAASKLTLLEGPPGAGKTTLLCDWIARVSRGEALPGAESTPPAEPDATLVIAGDGGLADVVAPRLAAAGANSKHVGAIISGADCGRDTPSPTIPADLDYLKDFIFSLGATLVVIDPLSALLGPSISRASPAHDRAFEHACALLANIAARTRAAIVVTRHPSHHPIPSATCALHLAPHPDDPATRILASTRCNLTLPPPTLAYHLESVPDTGAARIVPLGESPRTAADILHPQSPATQTERAAAKAWLQETLAPGPLAARRVEDMAKRAGFKPHTLRRAREDLGITSQRTGLGTGSSYLWSLPLRNNPAPSQVVHVDNLDNLDNLDNQLDA